MEETEDDGEDEVITSVQFVTNYNVLCAHYSCVFIYLYILQLLCIPNVPQCLSDHLLLGVIWLKTFKRTSTIINLYIDKCKFQYMPQVQIRK